MGFQAQMRRFEPLFRNPHISTILANFWPRKFDFSPFRSERNLVQTDEDTRVLVHTQWPTGEALGHVVLLHGLEGGGEAGYCISMAYRMLASGFICHRFHMRTCGGTESYCKTLYHGGLTSDVRAFVEQLRLHAPPNERELPVILIGFSLGGNIALKLAGELGETTLIQGVCSISTPIDLAAGVRRIAKLDNRIYERRFLKRMRKRLLATGRFQEQILQSARSIYEIDDRVTAPSFGFRGADHYYETQSAVRFLDQIRVPARLIQAKDDTFIPFSMYEDPAIARNPAIELLATEHGGHLGYLSRTGHRFWLDDAALDFVQKVTALHPTAAGASHSLETS